MSLDKYKALGMNHYQLEVINKAYKSHINQNDIDKYLSDPVFDNLQMEVILDGLKAGIDVSIYAKHEIDYESMRHILNQKLLDKEKELSDDVKKEKIILDEKKSNTRKNIILISSIIILMALVIFLSKDYILGSLQTLEIEFTSESVTIPVNSNFDAKKYVKSMSQGDNIQITYPNLNTSDLGTYYVDYIISNPYRILKKQLEVNIIDNEAPKLSLIEDTISLTRNVDTFDCNAYIESTSDNYDDDPKVSCSSDIDWSKDEVEVDYVILDGSGNESTETLHIIIEDKKLPEATYPTLKTEESESSHEDDSNDSLPSMPNNPVSPFLNGVHDISVASGTSLNDMIYLLSSGISASGNIVIDYSSVNLSQVGTYTVYFSTSDGLSKTCTVTVY